MSLFPTKFVCDVDVVTFNSQDTVEATLTVGGTVILRETYSPANGVITVRGLRSVLEAAIYGDLTDTGHASAQVSFVAGNYTESRTLYASRFKNPRDPNGTKTILAAGDLVMVIGPNGQPLTAMQYTTINGLQTVSTSPIPANGALIGDTGAAAVHVWIDHTSCPDNCVAVRFLNRYDVPQTMMTTRPLDIKPAFQDQTQLYLGQHVRYSVEQQDEYTLRSGHIHSRSEYASWADFVTSRKAEVFYEGQWLPIIITKSNFTVARRSMGMQHVEISFRMADPHQAL